MIVLTNHRVRQSDMLSTNAPDQHARKPTGTCGPDTQRPLTILVRRYMGDQTRAGDCRCAVADSFDKARQST